MPNKQTRLNAQKPDGKIADLGSLSEQTVRGGDVPLGQLLVGIAALPSLLKLAEEQALQIECLLREVRELRSKVSDVDGWMDARGRGHTWAICRRGPSTSITTKLIRG